MKKGSLRDELEQRVAQIANYKLPLGATEKKMVSAYVMHIMAALKQRLPEKKEVDEDWLGKTARGEKTLNEILAEDKRYNRGFNAVIEAMEKEFE